MFYFIKKSHKSIEGHPPSYFYKKQCEHKAKVSYNFENSFISKTRKKIIYETNK